MFFYKLPEGEGTHGDLVIRGMLSFQVSTAIRPQNKWLVFTTGWLVNSLSNMVASPGQQPWLRPGYQISLMRIGYCSNTKMSQPLPSVLSFYSVRRVEPCKQSGWSSWSIKLSALMPKHQQQQQPHAWIDLFEPRFIKSQILNWPSKSYDVKTAQPWIYLWYEFSDFSSSCSAADIASLSP